MCGYLLLSPGRSHFRVALAPIGAACTLTQLWCYFGRTPAEGRSAGQCGGGALGVSKVCAGGMWSRTCGCFEKLLLMLI